MPEWLQVTSDCFIDTDEFIMRFSTSGGPGGQHANRSHTRVELQFDIASSPSLTDAQRERLLLVLGSYVRIVADDERSQLRNRSLAVTRLRDRLASALVVPQTRRATKPTHGAKRRRVEAKRLRGDQKRLRKKPDPSD